MKNGICSAMGRQPPAGFTPFFLYRSINSAFLSAARGSRTLMPLNLSLMAVTWGCSDCIFFIERMLVIFRGHEGDREILVFQTCEGESAGVRHRAVFRCFGPVLDQLAFGSVVAQPIRVRRRVGHGCVSETAAPRDGVREWFAVLHDFRCD